MTQILNSLDEVNELLANVAEDFRLTELLPYMQQELNNITDLHQGFFSTATAPTGEAWAANAPRTIREKGHARQLYGKPRNGYRLSTSLTQKANQTTGEAVREAIEVANGGMITFGSLVPYSVYNEFGTSRIPARPHTGLTDAYLDAATERLADTAIKQLIA